MVLIGRLCCAVFVEDFVRMSVDVSAVVRMVVDVGCECHLERA